MNIRDVDNHILLRTLRYHTIIIISQKGSLKIDNHMDSIPHGMEHSLVLHKLNNRNISSHEQDIVESTSVRTNHHIYIGEEIK